MSLRYIVCKMAEKRWERAGFATISMEAGHKKKAGPESRQEMPLERIRVRRAL